MTDSKVLPVTSAHSGEGWRTVLMAGALTLVVFAANLYSPRFSADSWTYLELSNRVFTDFYRYNTLRQFEHPSPYSNSFPPAWPVLIAIFRKALDIGIYAGYVINAAICIGLLLGLASAARKIGYSRWVGAVAYLCIFAFPGYLDEALAARAIPLTLLLFTIAVLPILPAGRCVSIGETALCGVLLGVACLSRFDCLFPAAILGGTYVLRCQPASVSNWRCKIIASGVLFATVLAVLSPWAAYGISRFGKLLPSDNARQLLSARAIYVLDYFETPPSSDLVERPLDWIRGLLAQKVWIVALGLGGAIRASVVPGLISAALITWGGRMANVRSARVLSGSAYWLLIIASMVVTSVLVGYGDGRYYSGPLLICTVALLCCIVRQTESYWDRRRVAILILLAAALLIPSILGPLYRSGFDLASLRSRLAPVSPTREMRDISSAVQEDARGRATRLLFSSDTYPKVFVYGALVGEEVSTEPRIANGSLASFIKRWAITHLYDPNRHLASLSAEIELIPLRVPGLYRVSIRHTISSGQGHSD